MIAITHGIPPELVVEKKNGFNERKADSHTELTPQRFAGDFSCTLCQSFFELQNHTIYSVVVS